MPSRFTFPYRPPPGIRKKGTKGDSRLFPLLPFRFKIGDKVSKEWEALVDSGADYILIPKSIGEFYDLPRTGPDEISTGIGGKMENYPTRVNIIIGRGERADDMGMIEARVMKVDIDIPILFGRIPLFEKYKVIFMEPESKYQLVKY